MVNSESVLRSRDCLFLLRNYCRTVAASKKKKINHDCAVGRGQMAQDTKTKLLVLLMTIHVTKYYKFCMTWRYPPHSMWLAHKLV